MTLSVRLWTKSLSKRENCIYKRRQVRQEFRSIHDDLPCMDNDDMRRGRPSCHKAFGEATALLAGDTLLTAAFETLSGSPGTAVQNTAAVCALSRAAGANGMVWGQELDLAF